MILCKSLVRGRCFGTAKRTSRNRCATAFASESSEHRHPGSGCDASVVRLTNACAISTAVFESFVAPATCRSCVSFKIARAVAKSSALSFSGSCHRAAADTRTSSARRVCHRTKRSPEVSGFETAVGVSLVVPVASSDAHAQEVHVNPRRGAPLPIVWKSARSRSVGAEENHDRVITAVASTEPPPHLPGTPYRSRFRTAVTVATARLRVITTRALQASALGAPETTATRRHPPADVSFLFDGQKHENDCKRFTF